MIQTRIVCTIGPASEGLEMAIKMIKAGMNVARLNFSHGTHDQHRANYLALRQAAAALHRPLAILQDLQGPKIRVGLVPEGGVQLTRGQKITIRFSHQPSAPGALTTEYEHFEKDVKPGEDVLIDDGQIRLRAVSKSKKGVECVVTSGGTVKEHKGINLPATRVSASSLSKKDRDDLEFGADLGVDWVAMSFVRTARDITELRKLLAKHGSKASIVAKIELPEALKNIDEIIRATDAIMVARGDLGVEIPVERVPVEQKHLIAKCNLHKRPVIVATQMLESMITSPIPTRAESTDVANAVYDGTDAVMLSAESASGMHPIDAVKVMARIIAAAEHSHDLDHCLQLSSAIQHRHRDILHLDDAISDAAVKVAGDVKAKVIVVLTERGETALLLSKYRPQVPIIACTPHEQTYNQLALVRGVYPVVVPFTKDPEDMIEQTAHWLRSAGHVKKGDVLVMVGGMPLVGHGRTNFVKLHRA